MAFRPCPEAAFAKAPQASRYILVQVDRWYPKIGEAQSANQSQREHSKEEGSPPLRQADVFCACHRVSRTHQDVRAPAQSARNE